MSNYNVIFEGTISTGCKIEDVKRDFDVSFLKDKTFRVDCERTGEHDFKSIDIETALGEQLYEKTKSKVDFKNPDIVIHLLSCQWLVF